MRRFEDVTRQFLARLEPGQRALLRGEPGNRVVGSRRIPISLHDIQVATQFASPPAAANGLWMGFEANSGADATIVPANRAVIGRPTLSSLLSGDTDNCSSHDDRDSWNEYSNRWYYVDFVAGPADFVGRWAEAQAESRVWSCRAVEALVGDRRIEPRDAPQGRRESGNARRGCAVSVRTGETW